MKAAQESAHRRTRQVRASPKRGSARTKPGQGAGDRPREIRSMRKAEQVADDLCSRLLQRSRPNRLRRRLDSEGILLLIPSWWPILHFGRLPPPVAFVTWIILEFDGSVSQSLSWCHPACRCNPDRVRSRLCWSSPTHLQAVGCELASTPCWSPTAHNDHQQLHRACSCHPHST